MKDIFVIDHVSLIRDKSTMLDEDTKKSYNVAAERLIKLAKRNMRVILRKEKIKKICQN